MEYLGRGVVVHHFLGELGDYNLDGVDVELVVQCIHRANRQLRLMILNGVVLISSGYRADLLAMWMQGNKVMNNCSVEVESGTWEKEVGTVFVCIVGPCGYLPAGPPLRLTIGLLSRHWRTGPGTGVRARLATGGGPGPWARVHRSTDLGPRTNARDCAHYTYVV